MDLDVRSIPRLGGDGIAQFMRASANFEARLRPDSWLGLSGEPVTDFNAAYVGDGPDPAARLEEYVRVFQTHGIGGIVICHPAIFKRLASLADQLGLTHVGVASWMVCQATGAISPSATYHVTRVETAEELAVATELMSGAFALPLDAASRVLNPAALQTPGFTIFLARRDGVAFSTVLTTEQGSIVGVWAMGTPPERQRQGAGRAVL